MNEQQQLLHLAGWAGTGVVTQQAGATHIWLYVWDICEVSLHFWWCVFLPVLVSVCLSGRWRQHLKLGTVYALEGTPTVARLSCGPWCICAVVAS